MLNHYELGKMFTTLKTLFQQGKTENTVLQAHENNRFNAVNHYSIIVMPRAIVEEYSRPLIPPGKSASPRNSYTHKCIIYNVCLGFSNSLSLQDTLHFVGKSCLLFHWGTRGYFHNHSQTLIQWKISKSSFLSFPLFHIISFHSPPFP